MGSAPFFKFIDFWSIFKIKFLASLARYFPLSFLLIAIFYVASTSAATLTITDLGAHIEEGITYNKTPYFSTSGGVAPYTYTITVTGGPAAVDFVAGGLVFNSDGTLSGQSCNKNGDFTYNISVTDFANNTATSSGGNTVNKQPSGACSGSGLTLTANAPTGTTVGSTYTQTNVASGGTSPYTFYTYSGTLPPGTSLNSSTGTVSGTLTTAGTYNYTIQVTDSASNTAFGTTSVTISTASLSRSTITASPTTVNANGTSTSTITVQLKDSSGTNLVASGGTVTLTTTLGTLSSVADHANGTYTATITSTTSGLATELT